MNWRPIGKAAGEHGQQRLRKLLEEHGTRIATPEDRSFETEGEVIESGFRRTLLASDTVMRNVIQAAYRFRDAALIAEKKDDFGSALQNLYHALKLAGTVTSTRWSLSMANR